MTEYKYSVGVKHKSTGEKLKLEVWAGNVDAATHKLTGTLIGPECEYIWTGSGPIYENNQLICRDCDDCGAAVRADALVSTEKEA